MPKNNKFYITTSIAYANAAPHIGFALECLQADVLARYNRAQGKDVFFLTGTDEHGQKIANTAKKKKKDPKEFTDEVSEKFRVLNKILNISNNDFIRTTDNKKHTPAVKEVWEKLEDNGDIYKKEYEGLYCEGCEAFLTEKELENGECPHHQEKPKKVKEENYFFKLSKYEDKIKKVIEGDRINIVPKTRKKEMLKIIEEGLEDVSFSRPTKKVNWGIKVPGDKNQTIYCWADALLNYISGIGYYDNKENFKKFWPADIHCIGKDIQKFHSLIWPGMLLSLGLDLPKNIYVHGFITVEGKKMSKSVGNVIDPIQLVEKYGSEAVRYFFLSEVPPTKDGDFSYKKFEKRYNSDLANGLGNLVSRVLTLAKKKDIEIEDSFNNKKIEQKVEETKNNYEKLMKSFNLNRAVNKVWELISFSDRYIEKKKPWKKKDDYKEVLADLLKTIKEINTLIRPFLPETTLKIKKQLKTKKKETLFPRI